MIESIILSQLPAGSRFERVDRGRVDRLNAILSRVEHALSRELNVYVAHGAAAESFALEDDAGHAVVFGKDQSLRTAFARELFLSDPIIEPYLPGLARTALLRIMAHRALALRQGDLAADLFATAFEATDGLYLTELEDDTAHGFPIDEARVCFWHLAILHEIGHLIPFHLPHRTKWVEQARELVIDSHVSNLRPIQKFVADALETSLDTGPLTIPQLCNETLADCFAVDVLFRNAAAIAGQDITYDLMFAECVAWLSAMNITQRVCLLVDLHCAPHPSDAALRLAVQEAVTSIRVMLVCQHVTELLAPVYIRSARPTRADHESTMRHLFAILSAVRSRDGVIEAAGLRVMKVFDDLPSTGASSAVDGLAKKLAGREGVVLIYPTRQFLDAAESLSSARLDVLREALGDS